MSKQTHELKCWPEYFQMMIDSEKPFEYRIDDRHYAVGDTLKLREYDPRLNAYSGRWCQCTVGLVLRDVPGMPHGYCLMRCDNIR